MNITFSLRELGRMIDMGSRRLLFSVKDRHVLCILFLLKLALEQQLLVYQKNKETKTNS